MCGLFGVLNGKTGRRAAVSNFLSNAVVTGVLRGDDSTGLMQVDRDKKSVWIHKQALPGPIFLDQKQTRRILNAADSEWATIGHHRAATHGKVNNENAHPFYFQRADESVLCGVHNGVINNHVRREKDPVTGEWLDFEVDSEWAFWKLTHEGDAAFAKFMGWFAMIYYDSAADVMKVAVNGGRSLSYAFVKDADIVLMASEHKMLEWLADRNNLVIEDPISFKADTITAFGRSDLRQCQVLPLPQKPPYVAPAYTGSHSRYDQSGRETRNERRRDEMALEPYRYGGYVEDPISGMLLPTHTGPRNQETIEIERAELAAAMTDAGAVKRREGKPHVALVTPPSPAEMKDFARRDEIKHAQDLNLLGEPVSFQPSGVTDDRAVNGGDGMYFKGYITPISDKAKRILGVDPYPAIIRHAEQMTFATKFPEFHCKIVGMRMVRLPNTDKEEFEFILSKPSHILTNKGNVVDEKALITVEPKVATAH